MNYRHVFHAGNFADVVKHIVLIALLSSLSRKDKPYCYIDTHGGAGCYDLFAESAEKSKEYLGGIEKIIQQNDPPQLVKFYLNAIHQINNRISGSKYASLRYYPGSPLLARQFLRASDRMIACELHPEDYQALRNTFLGDKQVAIHHADGFLGLKAFLPPKEKRGLILIDPPYEDPDEFTRIASSLPIALKRFESGIFAIWFPIKEKKRVERFYQALTNRIDQPILAIELTIYPDIPSHLNGMGMVIVNPPWKFDETINSLLPWLWKALTINNQGYNQAFFLK